MVKKRKGLFAGIASVAVAGAMALGLVTSSISAAEPELEKETITDASTVSDWTGIIEKNTEHIGRIWTDKTVSKDGIRLPNFPDRDKVIEKGENSDFITSLSALSSTSSTTTTSSVPLDIVLVLDQSGSMRNNFGNRTETIDEEFGRRDDFIDLYNKINSGVKIKIDNTFYPIQVVRQKLGIFRPYTYTISYVNDDGETVFLVEDQENALISSIVTEGTFWYETTRTVNVSRVQALKDATSSFVSAVEKNASETGVAHRIAVVGFGSGGSNYENTEILSVKGSWGNVGVSYNAQGYQNAVSNALQDTTDSEGQQMLEDSIDALDTNGATRTDLGMDMARDIIAWSESNDSDRKRIVIMFTDGEPTTSSNFSENVANDTISYSHTINGDIYTIGIFSGANVNGGDQNNRFMNYTSSNYPNATSMNNPGDPIEESKRKFYKPADDVDGLNSVFEEIVEESISGTGSPTKVEEGHYESSGYITFNDRLGDYMEVDNFHTIVFADTLFTNPTVNTDGNVTTYTFTGEVSENSIYPDANLADIEISVTKGSSEIEGDLITARIPASMIPLRYFNVEENENGDLTGYIDEAYPIRLLYDSSMKKDKDGKNLIEQRILTNDYNDDLEDYIGDNTADGKVKFYANEYRTNNGVEVTTTSNFVPAETNSFYYFTQDTPLYIDENLDTRATSYVPGTTYYYAKEYFDFANGVESIEKKTIAYDITPTTEGYRNNITNDENGIAIKKGTPKIYRVDDTHDTKDDNATGTSNIVINPTWAEGNTAIQVALGNNGRIDMELPETLTVSKTVETSVGFEIDKDKEFEFTFELTNAQDNTVAYNMQKFNSDKSKDGEITTITSGGKFNLKHGQYVEIYGLSVNDEYKVAETEAQGYKTLANNDETREVSGTILSSETNEVNFQNTYSPAPIELNSTELNIGGTKTLTGRDFLESDRFVFNIIQSQSQDPNLPCPSFSEQTVTLEKLKGISTQDFDFGKVTFEKPGKYLYAIYEVKDNVNIIPGITYDTNVYRLEVDVVDNGDGTLTEKHTVKVPKIDGNDVTWVAYNGDRLQFTNTYSADTQSLTLSFSKQLNGKALSDYKEAQFGFMIETVAYKDSGSDTWNTGQPDVGYPEPDKTRVPNLTTGEINFSNLKLENKHVGKQYAYRVYEMQPTKVEGNKYSSNPDDGLDGAALGKDGKWIYKGVTFDNTEKYVVITVDQTEAGQIQPLIQYYDGIDNTSALENPTPFINRYNAEDVSLNTNQEFKVTKNLVGREWIDTDKFTFTLSPSQETPDAPMPTNSNTAEINAETSDKTASFGTITYDKAGTYKYEVTENEPEDKKGIDYSQEKYMIIVKIVDNGEGQLVVDSIQNQKSGSENLVDGSTVEFTNSYSATGTISGEADLRVKKVLEGREWTVQDSFEFTLKADENHEATVKAIEEGKVVLPTGSQAKISLNKGVQEKYFGNIIFNAEGEYHFVIEETKPKETSGITYAQPQKVIVTVLDENKDGKFTITTNNDTGVFEFTNEYKSTGSLEGLNVRKVFIGKEWQDEKFNFELVAKDGSPVPETTLLTLSKTTQRSTFGEITFNQSGNYVYEISEVEPDDSAKVPGVTYDKTAYRIKVSVTDDGKGNLTATPRYYVVENDTETLVGGNEAVFRNVYDSEDVSLNTDQEFKVTKNLEGRDWIDTDKFTFTLSPSQETPDAPMPTNSNTAEINAETPNKTASFGTITYDKAGTYKYEVIENEPENKNGINYSKEKYTITVEVVDNTEAGKLEIKTITNALEGAEEVSGANVTFTNTYSATGLLTGENAPIVIKNFTGRQDDTWLDTDVFSFKLTANNQKQVENGSIILPESTTVEINSSTEGHKARFGDIQFTKPGKYEFKIEEIQGVIPGIKYDKESKEFVVSVTDNHDGSLSSSIEGGINEFIFNNTYNAGEYNDVPTDFTLTKIFVGREWLEDDKFDFELTPAQETPNAPMPKESTIKVEKPESGNSVNFNFGNISYTVPGEYKYEVREIKPENVNNGIDYSTIVAKVTVTVTDNKEGALVASASVENSIFTNTYSSSLDYDAHGGLTVIKNMTNMDQTDGQFTFKLTAEDEQSAKKADMSSTEVEFKNSVASMNEGRISTSEMKPLSRLIFTMKIKEKHILIQLVK